VVTPGPAGNDSETMSWLRRSPRVPAYAVEGVEPVRYRGDWDNYNGAALAARPVVAEALAQLPPEPELAELPYSLDLGTQDGLRWSLSFGDECLYLFDLSHPGGSDIFEQTLTAAPFTVAVERSDRDIFDFTVPQVLAADVVFARCVEVCAQVRRRLLDQSF
jgi:hypothetical protein